MDIRPYKWNGTALTVYSPTFPDDGPELHGVVQSAEVLRSGTWPVRGGKTFTGVIYTLRLQPQVAQTISAFRDAIALLFNEEKDEESVFTIQDVANSNKEYYVNAECLGVIHEAAGYSDIAIHAADPVWKSVAIDTNTKSLTASGQTKDITVGGTRIARPQYSLKPTTPRTGGYGYKRYVAIANVLTTNYNDSIIVTNGNFAHLTLVGAGKALASGFDFRVIKQGAQIARWAGGGGFNTNTLRVFCNFTLPPAIALTLSGTLSNVGAISSITVKSTAANKLALQQLAKQTNRVIAISLGTGSEEIFTFTSVTPAAYTINGTTRAQRGSTNKSQVDGATIRHIPFDVYVVYGNSAAVDPNVNDAFKPMVDMANTTTSSKVYTDYADSANPSRLGQWVSSILANVGSLCRITRANHATDAVVASEMGMLVSAYKQGATPRAGSGKLRWTLTHPAGFTSITPSGEKFRRHAGTGFPTATLQKFDGAKFVVHATEATPVAANTWEATTVITGAQALGATYQTVGFMFEGPVNAVADTYAAIEFDSITLALDTTRTPIVSFGSEIVNEWQEFKIENTTTGQYMNIEVPGDVNNTVYIDTKALDAYVVETGERFPVFLDDESRAEWLPLDPSLGSGVNTIKITQAGLNAATLTVTHEERNN